MSTAGAHAEHKKKLIAALRLGMTGSKSGFVGEGRIDNG